jgi:hypothetical protein
LDRNSQVEKQNRKNFGSIAFIVNFISSRSDLKHHVKGRNLEIHISDVKHFAKGLNIEMFEKQRFFQLCRHVAKASKGF